MTLRQSRCQTACRAVAQTLRAPVPVPGALHHPDRHLGRTQARCDAERGVLKVAESEWRHDNVISGSAELHGPTVQARDVRGGIHFHQGADAPAPPPPRQLPAVPWSFTSRGADLAVLDGLLHEAGQNSSAQPLIVITGSAGIGKTTLASKWLRGLEQRYAGGCLYADLKGHTQQGPALASEVLAHLLRGLGAPSVPADPAEQATLWRTYASRRRIVVMLDNAFTAAQVRAVLPGDPGSLVVVTSRRSLSGLVLDGGRFHRLLPLSGEDGIDLLSRVVGADRVAGQRSAAARIVTLCAGLPLAVCLASARLAARPAQPLAALADDLADVSRRLSALDVDGETTVSHALDASYGVLSAEAMTLYRRLGVLPVRDFDAHLAAAVCDRDLGWARHHLDELRDANLVEEPDTASVRFHDLVRVHAGERAAADDPVQVRDQALRRACDWYLYVATSAQARITPAQYTLSRTYAYPPQLPVPFDGEPGALSWLDRHRDDLMTVITSAADRGWHTTGWQLVDAMWPLFLRLRHYELWIRAHETGLRCARRAGDAEAARQMLNSGAIGLSAAGRTGEAARWYTLSLRAAREAGDVRDEGQALHGLGTCALQTGELARAAEHLTAAVAVWQSCGYGRGVALSRIVLGEVALAEDRVEQARQEFATAYDALMEVDDPHDATRARALLGSAQARAGDHAAGRDLMLSALEAFTASGATHWQARTLEMLADCAQSEGDRAAGAGFRARAVALYEMTSPRDALRLAGPATPAEENRRGR